MADPAHVERLQAGPDRKGLSGEVDSGSCLALELTARSISANGFPPVAAATRAAAAGSSGSGR